MAVVPMKRLDLYGLKGDRKAVLELLQRFGAVEVCSPEEAPEPFARHDTSQKVQQLEQQVRLLEDAAALVDRFAPEKKGMLSMLKGRPPISPQEYEKAAGQAPAMEALARELASLGQRLGDLEAKAQRLGTQLESLKPWAALDIPLEGGGTRETAVFIGSLPEAVDQGALAQALAQALPEAPVVTETLSQQPQQTCLFALCLRRNASQVEEALRQLGFARPSVSSPLPPAQQAQALEEELRQVRRDQEQAKEDIRSKSGDRQGLLLAADLVRARAEKYQVLGKLWQSPRVFYLSGYLPAQEAPRLAAALESRFTLWVELADPGPQEEPPVKLKNNFFTSPMEGVVAGYSLPSKLEVDPSAVMAFFYYVLFGMMLSDAAYGILMVLGCGFALWKFHNLEEGMRKSLRMFLFCGISTTVWGVLFGSYFGDAIPVICETFFHREVTVPALWFEPLSDPMRLLIFSFGVGVLHLFTGLGVQFYQLAKQKKYADAIYDVVFWYLLVGGLIVVLLSTEIFQNIAELPFTVPGPVAMVAGVLAGIGAVGILLTAGRESRSPVKRLLKGIYGLYGVSSYLSDILSYSRLLALGLATSVISTVFNQLGAMLGGGVVGAVFFALVFVIGHSMNMAINVLGAYVHTNRLQFVEFFGKFYEGGGKPFAPFATHPKHFQIKEEK